MSESIEEMAGEGEGKRKQRKPNRLPAAEKVERDKKLVTDRIRGAGWEKLAVKYDLSVSACKLIVKQWRDENKPTFKDADPIDVVHELLGRYEAWIEQLAEIGEEADNDNARIGAVNSQMSAQAKIIDLCQATGLLPKDLGTLRVEMDVRILAQKIIQVFEEHDVSPEVRMALLAALEQRN